MPGRGLAPAAARRSPGCGRCGKASRRGLRERRGETRFPGPARARLGRRPRRGRAGARRATESARRRAGRTRGERSAPPARGVRSCRRRVARSSAHRLLHERVDPGFNAVSQLLQREGAGPHGAVVEVRVVLEAERCVPRLELRRALEEADDLAVLGIRGHPVPESRREGWRAGFDHRMEPLAHGPIRFPHRGDLREHGAFPVCLIRARAGARVPLLRGLIGGALGASGTFTHSCSLSAQRTAALISSLLICGKAPHLAKTSANCCTLSAPIFSTISLTDSISSKLNPPELASVATPAGFLMMALWPAALRER